MRERASRRETLEVRGWTMARATRSERVGREGEVRSGVTMARLSRTRRAWRRGVRERWRRWWFTWRGKGAVSEAGRLGRFGRPALVWAGCLDPSHIGSPIKEWQCLKV